VSDLVRDVAVLYVDPRGPYPKLVEHWYDEARDARTYAGPWPVVAHPPCGPWSRLSFLCTKQDASLGPIAVDQVRRWGGVLEHPYRSKLFRHCAMPYPGEMPDRWGGRTYDVRQVNWGHRCEKETWLYVVGTPVPRVLSGIRTGQRATHRITNGSRGRTDLPRVGELEARCTPPDFARWLISLAQQARVAHPAATERLRAGEEE
jgi:hypothetical protein